MNAKLIPMFETKYSWDGYETNGHGEIDGCETIMIGSPSEIDRYNPPSLLVLAVEGCAATHVVKEIKKAGLVLVDYESEATGSLEKLIDGGYRIGLVEVNMVITLQKGSNVDLAKEAVKKAGEECLVANSLTCPVYLIPTFQFFPEV